jgi:hypothetical protein
MPLSSGLNVSGVLSHNWGGGIEDMNDLMAEYGFAGE